MSNTQNQHYKLTITLLEDLHTGTGTGNITVDSVQARNEKGIPIIDRHHFRGVMRDNALRLVHLKAIEQQEVDTLFGTAGGEQRKLDCSSLVANKKDCLIYWDATARKKGSRCPEDNSLRRIEYIKGGTRLDGSISLNQVTDKEIEAFNKILKFTTRLGAERTRGSGQIKINKKLISERRGTNNNPLAPGVYTFRVILKNEEPLCIPTSGYAGNIIHTESYIPGRTIFAAICNQIKQSEGENALEELFTNELQIGNAYPIPAKDINNLQHITCLPMPNHIHGIKQQASNHQPTEENIKWPHWADKSKDTSTAILQYGKYIDLFHQTKTEKAEQLKTKRPKGAVYLFKDHNNQWHRYQQALTIRMRNQRGDPLNSELKRKDTELFSEQRIPAGTQFLLEVSCKKGSLLKKVSKYLGKNHKLRIGRSKSPVISIDQIPCNKPIAQSTNNEITIIATSDWIIRGSNLGYLTHLNKDTLAKALGISLDAVNMSDSYQETETQGSFNYVTRLPKRPFDVIRRGSSFKITGDNEELKTIFEELSSITTPIGEHITEGYGQFAINLPVTLGIDLEEEDDAPHDQEQEDVNTEQELTHATEANYNKIKEDCEAYYNLCKEKSQSVPPTKEQWEVLKKQVLDIRDDTYQALCSSYLSKPEFNFLLKDQKGNNLGAQLNKLSREHKNNTHKIIEVFLSTLEQLLYGENHE